MEGDGTCENAAEMAILKNLKNCHGTKHIGIESKVRLADSQYFADLEEWHRMPRGKPREWNDTLKLSARWEFASAPSITNSCMLGDRRWSGK